jgi:glycosyltransferase involved in cell wall biosynthesis
VKIRGNFKAYVQIKSLAKKISGDLIYASKPLLSSFGVGLLNQLNTKKPVILDIDDWQMGFIKESYKNSSLIQCLKAICFSTLFLYRVDSFWNNVIYEKLAYIATDITVSGRFLQKKFGGEVIWHARDAKAFDPDNFNKNMLRKNCKIDADKKVVMFLGTPTPHKGVEDLMKAININKNKSIVLIVVGIGDDYYSKIFYKRAKELLGDRFIGIGLQPFKSIPNYLAMADLIVIPQRKNFATIGQVPAKVFDAMALAKPIIATNVSDLSEILEGCGYIVEPENPIKLSETIQAVLDNVKEAEEIGWKARQKLISTYCWDVAEINLVNLLKKYG